MNEEFITIYIEKAFTRISDLIKSDLLLNTQLELANKLNAELNAENEKLKAEIDKLKSKNKINTSEEF